MKSKYLRDDSEIRDIESADDLEPETLQRLAEEIIHVMEERGLISFVAEKYADSERTDMPEGTRALLFGSWNDAAPFRNNGVVYCDLGLLAAAHYVIEWHDEWDQCRECSGAVRTSPDGYSWRPRYWVQPEEGLICASCLEGPEDAAEWPDAMEAYIDFLRGNPKAAMTLGGAKALRSFGYKSLDSFTRGLHRGQSDNPERIAEALRGRGVSDFIFYVDSTSQSETNFSVWVREDADVTLPPDEVRDPPGQGPAEMAEAALRHASRNVPPGDGVLVVRLLPDGTSESRRVTAEEIVSGHALDGRTP